jgi:hypothetical protein
MILFSVFLVRFAPRLPTGLSCIERHRSSNCPALNASPNAFPSNVVNADHPSTLPSPKRPENGTLVATRSVSSLLNTPATAFQNASSTDVSSPGRVNRASLINGLT